jgi:hypothetical protein
VMLGVSHTVSGNPSRFEAGRTRIARDDRWQDSMPRGERLLTTALTSPLLHRYGYPMFGGRSVESHRHDTQ